MIQNRPFFRLFTALTPKEVRHFKLYLASPYFNRRAELASFLDVLEDLKLNGTIEVSKEWLYKKVFPGLPFDDLECRRLFSYFKKAIEGFLIQKEWESDDHDKDLRLLRALRRKEVSSLYDRTLRTSLDHLDKEPFRDLGYHYTRYQLFLEHYEYTHRVRRGGEMRLQEQTDALTLFYVSGILRQSCIILSHQNLNPGAYSQPLLDAVLSEVREGPLLQEPAVAIYYHSLRALQSPEHEEDFHEAKKIIDGHWQAFRPMEIRDIYILAINYCIRRLNDGNRAYVREAFDLYQSGLERGCLLDRGQISPFAYKNVLMLGMSLDEYEWVEDFLHTFKTNLAPEIRENTFNYNLAIYYFRLPDYDKAMDLLQRVEFKDVLNNLDARRMLLRIYYEEGAFDALDSHLDSFRQYISRQKELGYHRDSYLNLIRFVKKALRTNLADQGKRKNLRKEVEAHSSFVEKDWLVEQLE